MAIKLYPTPGDFLRDNSAFLDRYEVQSQLNRGNAAAHRDEPCSLAVWSSTARPCCYSATPSPGTSASTPRTPTPAKPSANSPHTSAIKT